MSWKANLRNQRLWLAASAVIIVVVIAAFALLGSRPPPATPLRGALTQVGPPGIWSSGGGSGVAVSFQLNYTSPSSVSGFGLILTVRAPANETFFAWNGTEWSSVELRFTGADYPHWVTVLPGGGLSTALTGTFLSLDHGPVVLADSAEVYTGAILGLTFPIGMGNVSGSLVSVSVQGCSGTIATTVE
jgi:hypothetical protein